MSEWNLAKVLPIFLSGLLAALLTQGATFLRDYFVKSEQGRTSAMFVTLALEQYAAVAIFRVEDCELADSMPEAATFWTSVPAFPEFPANTEWRALGSKLAMKVLSCQAAVTASQTKLESLLAATDVSQTSDAAKIECLRVGYRLLGVAEDVRRKFRLGSREGDGREDLKLRFDRRMDEVAKSDEQDRRFKEAIANTAKQVRAQRTSAASG